MKLSNRMNEMGISPIRKLVPYSNKAKEKGIKIYHLNIGEPDIKTPKEYINAIRLYNEDILGYSKSNGLDELIIEISDYYKKYNMSFEKEDILITNGGSEALLFSLLSVCDENENILVFEPYYTNYSNIAHIANVNFNTVTTRIDDNFSLPSKEEIVKNIDENTKAILISNPSNPTGYVYSKTELNMLAQIAIENNLWIISDEVYREFVYDNYEYSSFGKIEEILDRLIIVDSISKRFSACGARIGCILSKNEEIISSVLKLCQSRLAVATLEQVGAAALYKVEQEYLENVNQEYERRRNILYKELKDITGVKCTMPKGAFYMIVELPVDDAEKFTIWMLEEFNLNNETVMLCPAKSFYKSKGMGIKEVRIAYVLCEKKLKKCANLIKEGLLEYNKNE